jgi:hypothetical protein
MGNPSPKKKDGLKEIPSDNTALTVEKRGDLISSTHGIDFLIFGNPKD